MKKIAICFGKFCVATYTLPERKEKFYVCTWIGETAEKKKVKEGTFLQGFTQLKFWRIRGFSI